MCFLADLGNSQVNAQFVELATRQWLCQDVCKLLLSADVLNAQPPISNSFTNVMESCVDVLTPLMEDAILTECYRRLAVHLQNEGLVLLTPQFRK